MKIRILSLILITFFLSSLCQAQAAEWMVYGVGGDFCGQWVTKRKGDDWYSMGQWMLGYITAAQDQAGQEFKNTDSQSMAVWLDNYCQKYPLNEFLDGVRDLVKELTVAS